MLPFSDLLQPTHQGSEANSLTLPLRASALTSPFSSLKELFPNPATVASSLKEHLLISSKTSPTSSAQATIFTTFFPLPTILRMDWSLMPGQMETFANASAPIDNLAFYFLMDSIIIGTFFF